MEMRTFGSLSAGLAGAAMVAGVGTAHASGFALLEQGVKQMGTNYAGAAAYARDPSVIAYNPAGIMLLEGTQISGAVMPVYAHGDFDGQGTYAITGAPVSGGEGGDFVGLEVVPSAFISHRLSPNAAIGLGVYVPFAQVTDYDEGWTGRYQAERSEITTINLNPVFAFKPVDSLSVGLGVFVQYFDATLTNDIDAGTAAALAAEQQFQQATGTPNPAFPAALNDTQGQYDVESELTGDDIAFGFNVGLLWQATDSTQMGLTYRSATTADVSGESNRSQLDTAALTADLTPYYGPLIGAGVAQGVGQQLASSDGSTRAKLPGTAAFGVRQELGSSLVALASVSWTDWSRFDELVVEYESGADPSVIGLDYDDTFRYAVGMEYMVSSALTLRAGVAYDESPIDDQVRRARVPDSDRTSIAIGTTFHATDNLSLDLGYQHLWLEDSDIEEEGAAEIGNTLVGSYETSADVFGVQVNYTF